jgi:glyoxylase-like metal-dependent hydrolase (beta-lactamase superfamily II)
MRQIIEQVYTIQGLQAGRVFVIDGDDGLTLVDTSLPKSEKRIATDLATKNYRLADVRHILITHAHPDHTGALAAIQQVAPNAKTYVHARDAAVTRGEAKSQPPPKESLRGLDRLMAGQAFPPAPSARVDVELHDGDALDHILPGLTVVDLPGHSPGQVGFWWPAQRLLMCGDLCVNIGVRFMRPFAAFTTDMAEAARSIRKAAGLNVGTLCLGHGQPYTGDVSGRLARLAERIEKSLR